MLMHGWFATVSMSLVSIFMKKHMDTYRADLTSGKLPGRFSYGLGTKLFQHLVSTGGVSDSDVILRCSNAI